MSSKCPHCPEAVVETKTERDREDGAKEYLVIKGCPNGCFNSNAIITIAAHVVHD